jgi:hypothetical protein
MSEASAGCGGAPSRSYGKAARLAFKTHAFVDRFSLRAKAVFVYQSLNPGAVVAVTLADEHQQTMATIPVARPTI